MLTDFLSILSSLVVIYCYLHIQKQQKTTTNVTFGTLKVQIQLLPTALISQRFFLGLDFLHDGNNCLIKGTEMFGALGGTLQSKICSNFCLPPSHRSYFPCLCPCIHSQIQHGFISTKFNGLCFLKLNQRFDTMLSSHTTHTQGLLRFESDYQVLPSCYIKTTSQLIKELFSALARLQT